MYFSLLGFSSSLLGAAGGWVSSVTSSLFQLNFGLGLRGGRSLRGRGGCWGRLSSCSFCRSFVSFSIFSLYYGCSSSDLLGSTSPFSTSSFGTYLGIIRLYSRGRITAEIIHPRRRKGGGQ